MIRCPPGDVQVDLRGKSSTQDCSLACWHICTDKIFALTKYDQGKWEYEWGAVIPVRVGDGAVQDGSQHSPVHQAPGLRSKMYLM